MSFHDEMPIINCDGDSFERVEEAWIAVYQKVRQH